MGKNFSSELKKKDKSDTFSQIKESYQLITGNFFKFYSGKTVTFREMYNRCGHSLLFNHVFFYLFAILTLLQVSSSSYYKEQLKYTTFSLRNLIKSVS